MKTNFKTFFKKPIAALLAFAMILSTLCSGGVPFSAAHAMAEAPYDTVRVDGRIITETAIDILNNTDIDLDNVDSFTFTAMVLNQLFGTTQAYFVDKDTQQLTSDTIDLAKDINEMSIEELTVIAKYCKDMNAQTAIPVQIIATDEKAKELQRQYQLNFNISLFYSNKIDDVAIINMSLVDVTIDGETRRLPELIALNQNYEGSLINRNGHMNITLGTITSDEQFFNRFQYTAKYNWYDITESTEYIGKSSHMLVNNGLAQATNIPPMDDVPYVDNENTPILLFVAPPPIKTAKTVLVKEVVDGVEQDEIIPATITYTTNSGAELPAGEETTERVTATVTLPNGYRWADDTNGQVEFDYWETEKVVNVEKAFASMDVTVKDMYDENKILTDAKIVVSLPDESVQLDYDKWQSGFDSNLKQRIWESHADTIVIDDVAAPGYQADPTLRHFRADDGTTVKETFKQVAKFKLTISNKDEHNTPIEGAEYVITYGDKQETIYTETITTNVDGIATTEIFLDNGHETISVAQKKTADGYLVGEETFTVPVTKDKLFTPDNDNDDSYFSLQYEDGDSRAPVYDYSLTINTVEDAKNASNTEYVSLDGVTLGIYGDAECTDLKCYVPSGEKQPEMDVGTYYVKVIDVPEGYTTQTFYPDADAEANNESGVFEVKIEQTETPTVLTIGVRRQRAVITVAAKDKADNTGVQGVQGKLVLKEANPGTYAGQTVDNDIVVGQFETGADGKVTITSFSDKFNNEALINGKYKAEITYIPAEYIIPDTLEYDLDCSYDKTGNVLTVNRTLEINLEPRQSVQFRVDFVDATENGKANVYEYYQNEGENTLVGVYRDSLDTEAGLLQMAYLTKGAKLTITMTTTAPVKALVTNGDTVTQIVIPAGTVVAEKVIENGETSVLFDTLNFIADEITYENLAIPEGSYEFEVVVDENKPLVGFELNNDIAGYDAEYKDSEVTVYSATREPKTITFGETLLTEKVVIHKTNEQSGEAISGIQFAMVPTDWYDALLHNVFAKATQETIPTNKELVNSLKYFNDEYDVTPVFTAYTDAEGNATFDAIPYGEYWLVEYTPDTYADASARKVFIKTADLTDEKNEPTVIDVTNTSKTAKIVVENIDKNTNAVLTGSKFELKPADSINSVEDFMMNDDTVSSNSYMDGDFRLVNTKAASGYVLTDDITISVSDGAWIVNGQPAAKEYDQDLKEFVIKVSVPSESNSVTITAKEDGVAIPDVEFVVTIDGTQFGTYTTNEEGIIKLEKVPAGKITITQTTIDGYVSVEPQTITVTDTEKEYTADFDNQKIIVTVKTLDGVKGWELNGVVVELKDADGNVIATFDDAMPTHTKIPAGTYYLHTVKMPDGYQAPSKGDIEIVVQDIADEQIFINNLDISENTDDDNNTHKPVYEDNRTYGTFSILKKDSLDKNPLAGVEFEFRYKNETVIDGQTYAAGTVIETLRTDKEGKASLSKKVPIASYTENGITMIEYTLVETKVPAGQYVPGTTSTDIETITFSYADQNTPLITLPEIEINNNRPQIVVTATSDPETRLFDKNGVVEGFEDITSILNGQEIVYTIKVTNVGNAVAHDIDVRDTLPEQFELTNLEAGSMTYDAGKVYWHIDELNPGDTKTLILKAKANSETAAIVDNEIDYFMPENAGETIDKDDESISWIDLPTSQFQIIHWDTKANEKNMLVSAYDIIGMNFEFNSVAQLKDFKVTDVIPEGLTFVDGTAKINGVLTKDYTYDEETHTIEFAPTTWNNRLIFSFDVKVDHIENGEQLKWTNKAEVSFLSDSYANKQTVLETDTTNIRADAMMDVSCDVDVDTYIGAEDESDKLTVLKKGDKVTYSVIVKNNGESHLRRVLLKDILPAGMSIKPIVADGVMITATNKDITWYVADVNPDKTIVLKFEGTVKDQEAAILDNYAKYELIDALPDVDEDANTVTYPAFTKNTDESDHAMYQVIEFHKAAEVEGQKVTSDKVAIGDTLVYTMSVNAKHTVDGVVVTDKLPAGVTFVPGSAQYKLAGDKDWTDVTDSLVYDKDTRTIRFATDVESTQLLQVGSGVSYFRFSATVDRIGTNNDNINNYNKSEFTNVASLDYRKVFGSDKATASLQSEAVSHMTEISLTGSKTGTIETFEGKYDNRKNVTVVVNGDELTFNIAVKNTGSNPLTNVVIKDVVPENTTLVKKDTDTYTENEGVLTWIVDAIEADSSANVSFTVKVAAPENKAVEIINKAQYAVPVDVNDIQESEWIDTNSVVYQVISITMSSSVAGGTDDNDAKFVEIGSTITYTITVECLDDIYNLKLSNKIPEGMTYVEDSAKVKIGDGESSAAKFTLDGQTISFNEFDEVKAGKLAVSFDVKVNDTTEYDKGVVFINQADGTLKPNSGSDKTITMKSNPIAHTTKKTNATDTPKLGLETTNASLVWGLVTMVALAGIGVFGYFGYIEFRKKREE